MTEFKFLDIDRLTNEVLSEAPVAMDMVSKEKYEKIKEQLDKGQGCRIQGTHEMYQVPSKIFLATDRDTWLINKLKKEDPDTYNKYSMEHYFEHFSFGDQSQQ